MFKNDGKTKRWMDRLTDKTTQKIRKETLCWVFRSDDKKKEINIWDKTEIYYDTWYPHYCNLAHTWAMYYNP